MLVTRIAVLLAAATAALFPEQTSAQPRALTPLVFTDADYPFASLLEAEEGPVGLELTLGNEGRPTAVRVTRSSGSLRLDITAAHFAQSRWRFEGGGGVHVPVEAVWTLPLTAAAELYLPVPATPPQGATPPQPLPAAPPRQARGFQPAPLAGNPPTLPVIADDYPIGALRAAESGVAGVRFLVKEDGELGESQLGETSGIKRLDDAAVRIIRTRWRAGPATAGGVPVAVWRTASVSFRPITNAPPPPRCRPRPVLGDDAVLITARQVNPVQSDNPAPDIRVAQRWIRVEADGRISDAMLHTAKGWMRFSPALVEALPAYPSPEQSTCWFYDPVPIRR
jgi:TonB family protein